MEQSTGTPIKPADDRDARLKAALKANLARRKAQARARNDNAPRDDENKEDKS